jgi:hypothetical protein
MRSNCCRSEPCRSNLGTRNRSSRTSVECVASHTRTPVGIGAPAQHPQNGAQGHGAHGAAHSDRGAIRQRDLDGLVHRQPERGRLQWHRHRKRRRRAALGITCIGKNVAISTGRSLSIGTCRRDCKADNTRTRRRITEHTPSLREIHPGTIRFFFPRTLDVADSPGQATCFIRLELARKSQNAYHLRKLSNFETYRQGEAWVT